MAGGRARQAGSNEKGPPDLRLEALLFVLTLVAYLTWYASRANSALPVSRLPRRTATRPREDVLLNALRCDISNLHA